jgi:hypothetical protein
MKKANTLAHRNPALQQESPNLVDDAGALADQPFAHAVHRLQVELVGRLRAAIQVDLVSGLPKMSAIGTWRTHRR